MFFAKKSLDLPTADTALAGRPHALPTAETHFVNGRPLTKTAQVRMCGNSVSPVMSEALARANVANDDGAERIAA